MALIAGNGAAVAAQRPADASPPAPDVVSVSERGPTSGSASDSDAAAEPGGEQARGQSPAQVPDDGAESRPALRDTDAAEGEPIEIPEAPEASPDPVSVQPVTRQGTAETSEPLDTFRGLSTWVDLHDTSATPEAQAAAAAAGGAQSIFVQSARHDSPKPIHDPERLAALIEAAHDHGLKVMVWYLPGFTNPAKDLRRSKIAINFTTPRGDRPDAFGLDIEVEANPDIAQRTERLLTLSKELWEWAGADYPLAAIVLPPKQLELRKDSWPDFPYAELTSYYDVFVPMSYSSFRGTDAQTTRVWNLQNINLTREHAGDPQLPIHLAGGIADNLPNVDAFVQAAEQGNVLGAGLYDLHTTKDSAWSTLQQLRVSR
jgi:hypothetical protein